MTGDHPETIRLEAALPPDLLDLFGAGGDRRVMAYTVIRDRLHDGHVVVIPGRVTYRPFLNLGTRRVIANCLSGALVEAGYQGVATVQGERVDP